MPETKPKTKKAPSRIPGANTQKLIDKLDELHETMLEIQHDVERMKPHSAWKRFIGNFGQGVLRGVGFVIGTTVLAALVIFLIQQALQTEVAQSWINERINQVLNQAVENAVEDTVGSIIQQL